LLAVYWADRKAGIDFAKWAARHVLEIPGGLQEICALLMDIGDWVRAGTRTEDQEFFEQLPDGAEFLTRPFTPSMSLKTVTALSAEWHEAVANNIAGSNHNFPSPWYPAAKIGNYEIAPIEDGVALYREGAAMHHCVGSYATSVVSGELFVYSIRHNGER